MIQTVDIEYDVGGRTMVGRLARPETDAVVPAVLIAHEGPGLDEHLKDRAAQMAALGYVAFALDYHGGGRRLADLDEMNARLDALIADPDLIRAHGQAALDVVLTESRADASRVGAVGYCFGGAVVLELARAGADLKAVVGMHPSLGTSRPDDARNITGSVLVCVGADDPFIPVAQRLAFEEQMRAAGVDWRMDLYGGVRHSFTNPGANEQIPGIKYDEQADRRSWRAMLDLFDEAFS